MVKQMKTFEIPLRGWKGCRQIVSARNRAEALRKVRRQQAKDAELVRKHKAVCFICNRPKRIIEKDCWNLPDYKIKGKLRFLPMDKRESGDNGFGDTPVCFKCVPNEFGRL